MASLKEFSTSTYTYTAVATSALYLFGYLAERFHLTALGVVTDLGVLDERYLFAGARFLAFLLAEIPVLALIGLPMALLARIVWRLVPVLHKRVTAQFRSASFLTWTSAILAIVTVRLWMSACVPLHDLALEGPPEPAWLFDLLKNPNSMSRTLFFLAMLICAAAVCAPLIAAYRLPRTTMWQRAVFGAAASLAVIVVLLLPVNYGVVVTPYSMERVAALGKTPLPAGQKAWLLYEGKEWMTYFVQTGDRRTLVSVPMKEIDRIEVSGSDSLFDVIYSSVGERR